MKKIILLSILLVIACSGFAQTRDIDKKILSLREQSELYNKNLEYRLDNILPEIMRREGVEMWMVINFENSEDPVYRTLTTMPGDGARRLSIAIFHDAKDGFKKLSATYHGAGATGYMYQSIYTDRSTGAKGQFQAVADYVAKVDPKNIAINFDDEILDDFSHANGLSHLHYVELCKALGQKYTGRLISAKNVVMGWYDTRSPWELSFYRYLCGMAHDLIKEFYSNAVITPDVTTTTDVTWWICERVRSMGLDYWFHPSLSITRAPADRAKHPVADRIIRRGDLLHCDVGISYMGLTTDMQHNAYVLREGETDAPTGVKALFEKGKRMQDIILEEMKPGRTGNEVLQNTRKRGTDEGLNPMVFSHPINYYGHGSGVIIGFTERQEGVAGTGNKKLFPNGSYSMEFSVAGVIPEWGQDLVRLGVEEDVVTTQTGARFIDGRQERLYLIR